MRLACWDCVDEVPFAEGSSARVDLRWGREVLNVREVTGKREVKSLRVREDMVLVGMGVVDVRCWVIRGLFG